MESKNRVISNKRTIEIEIYFDSGKILDSTKKLKGQFVDIPQEEIQQILNHAKKVQEVAMNLNPKLN
ncbi:MAG: hypothetical protein K6T54_12745 [Ignavibacterium sp.]|nr:hypothetical protein [Ignavibacterium sp.]